MTRLKIWLAFISILTLRFVTLPSPLPDRWKPESKIGYTVTIVEQPEYSDSQTTVKSGIWEIAMRGYKEIIPGSKVKFEGVIEPKWELGKVVQIKMNEPKVIVVGQAGEVKLGLWNRLLILLSKWRGQWVAKLQRSLPEPMAGLAAGILLGVKAQMPSDFYQALINTGTLHIIAASGYNVSVVAAVLMKVALSVAGRGVAIGIGIGGIVLYTLLAGAGASVVRAAVMGSLTLIAYYFGRPSEARRLFWVTAGLMLLINPLYLADVGFQLSFSATAGLLYLEPRIIKLSSRAKSRDPSTTVGMTSEVVGILEKFLAEYLYPTLAATIATLPVILWHFGRVAWISPLVNILVLPAVPLLMGLCALILLGGAPVAWLTYPLLWYLVTIIEWLGGKK